MGEFTGTQTKVYATFPTTQIQTKVYATFPTTGTQTKVYATFPTTRTQTKVYATFPTSDSGKAPVFFGACRGGFVTAPDHLDRASRVRAADRRSDTDAG